MADAKHEIELHLQEPAPESLPAVPPLIEQQAPEQPAAKSAEVEQRAPSCNPSESYAEITAKLQEITESSKRPLFTIITDDITTVTLEEIYGWKHELRRAGASDEGLDILIESPGGELTTCYMIARMLSRCSNSWEAFVPTQAASGATLICLGSSKIVMSEIAQLGPIDPQVLSKRQQKFFARERQSPLEAFQAVKYLREFAIASMDAGMQFLLKRGVAPQKALETASDLASGLVNPILNKIEPYDLGAFDLDSTLALEYCARVSNPTDPAKKTQRAVDYKALVERYPAHEFAIDIAEARRLNFSVSEPDLAIERLFDELRTILTSIDSYIGLVPTKG